MLGEQISGETRMRLKKDDVENTEIDYKEG
jgi:hypothetical protein